MTAMKENLDDWLLVERFNRGDESAFSRIIERHSAEIAGLANRLLGWSGDVEDVMQDVFLSVFLGLKTFRCQSSLRTWLFTITINKCRRYHRKRLISLRHRTGIIMKASLHQTSKVAMDAETAEQIRQAIAALPTKYREPVILRYLQELPLDQISRILGIKKNALQVRLTRAKQLIKVKLAKLIEE